jgi:hypothetical protein
MKEATRNSGLAPEEMVAREINRIAYVEFHDALLSEVRVRPAGSVVLIFSTLNVYEANGDGTVTFTSPNIAGANSFFYHLLPDRKSKTGWFRSIHQKFAWTEQIPQCPK